MIPFPVRLFILIQFSIEEQIYCNASSPGLRARESSVQTIWCTFPVHHPALPVILWILDVDPPPHHLKVSPQNYPFPRTCMLNLRYISQACTVVMVEPRFQPTCKLHLIHQQSPSQIPITRNFPSSNSQGTPQIPNGIAKLSTFVTIMASHQYASLLYSPQSLTTIAVYPHPAHLTIVTSKIVLSCCNIANITT